MKLVLVRHGESEWNKLNLFTEWTDVELSETGNEEAINACQSKYRVKYFRLPELFSEFEAQKIRGKYRQYIANLQKYDLLILDEFLLTSTSTSERENLLELVETRTNRKSTILCSQWTPSRWHEKLGGGAVADAILDRIINSSYIIELKGKSLREEYSKVK